MATAKAWDVPISTDVEADIATLLSTWCAESNQCPATSPGGSDIIRRLIAAGAWTDATLALIDIRLPQWRLRRLAFDAGEWHCSLSRQRDMPDWIDQSIDGHNARLPLAIMEACEAAARENETSGKTSVPPSPVTRLDDCEPMNCDNFR